MQPDLKIAKMPGGLPLPTDEDLIQECVTAGNWDAFETLARKYRKKIAAIASHLLNNPEEVEDVVQDTFVEALSSLQKYRAPQVFERWLIRIVVNNIRDRRRRFWFRVVSRHSEMPTQEHGEKNETEWPSGMTDAVVPHARKQVLRAVLRQSISAMPHKLSAALVLHFYHEYDAAEIGEILGMSEVSARVYLHRACQRLRKHLGPLFENR